MPNSETPLFTWICDSRSRESLHRNGPNLTSKASEIGYIERRADDDGDLAWGYVINGNYLPASTYARARKELEKAAVKILALSNSD